MSTQQGPLHGIRIIEMSGLGPAPFCGMMLADHGAEVIAIHRPGGAPSHSDPLARSKVFIESDLKDPAECLRLRELIKTADGLIEGFRPGVMEKLGLAPELLLEDNPHLVFGRMTGWGQSGPLAKSPGHDINYIALSGVLHACGRAGGKPTAPLNLVGDFGGGGMLLAFSMLAGLLHAKASGRGQVIDCAMTEGSALLMSLIWGLRALGEWRDERGVNLLDSGAHFYETYETSDKQFVSVGAIEPQFYRNLLTVLELENDDDFKEPCDRAKWPLLQEKFAATFRRKTRVEWCRLLEDVDVCFAPVLSMEEAIAHPHNVARQAFIQVDGVTQPAPAPRYSLTATRCPSSPRTGGSIETSLPRNDDAGRP